MLNERIAGLKDILSQSGIALSFSGCFSQGIIEEVGEAIKSYLKSGGDPKTRTRKLFSVYIEQTQNVKNYAASLPSSDENEKVMASGIMVSGERDGAYFVCSGNLVKNEHIAPLRKNLERLTQLDQKALSELYRERLKQDVSDDTTGAGLGLIEMARRASRPIEYDFAPRGDDYSFFTITVYV